MKQDNHATRSFEAKHDLKTSYRVNERIKSIIDRTSLEVRRNTGLELSLGKIARAFWTTLSEDPTLRKKCLDRVCRKILEEEIGSYSYGTKKAKSRR